MPLVAVRLGAKSLVFTCVVIFVCSSVAAAQQHDHASKFDSYGSLPTDDEAAHLDAFYEALRGKSHLRGYLVGYNQTKTPPGVFLRRLYGDRRYLVEMRGLDSDRVVVVEGGDREKLTIELWLVPKEAAPPTPAPVASPIQITTRRYLFDEECLECQPAVNLDLYGLSDGLKFYAELLRRNLRARGLMVVRPGKHVGTRGALGEARKAKLLLTRAHGIAAGRLTITLARRRKDNLSSAQMWIIK